MKTSILLVEDEAVVAADLEEHLRQLGYQVAGICATGEKAVELVDSLQPDLVIMDIRLKGGMDGVETAARIRETRPVPILFLTAHAEDATIQQAKQVEPCGYILKPVDGNVLAIHIEIALHEHGLNREREEHLLALKQAVEPRGPIPDGLFFICTKCHQVRTSRDEWEPVEVYLHHHAGVNFTHGYCPLCAQRMLDELEREEPGRM